MRYTGNIRKQIIGASLLFLFSYYAWVSLFCVHTHVLPIGLKQHAHPFASATHSHTEVEIAYIDAVMMFQCESAECEVESFYLPVVEVELCNEQEVYGSIQINLSKQLRAPPAGVSMVA